MSHVDRTFHDQSAQLPYLITPTHFHPEYMRHVKDPATPPHAKSTQDNVTWSVID